MGRHIIISFDVMLDKWHTLRDNMIEETLKVHQYCRVSIFIDGDTSRRMPDEYGHHSLVWHLTNSLNDIICYDMKPTTV
jgi:hypothetical protein